MTVVSLKDARAKAQIEQLVKDLDNVLELWRHRPDRSLIFYELQKLKWMQMSMHDRLRRLR